MEPTQVASLIRAYLVVAGFFVIPFTVLVWRWRRRPNNTFSFLYSGEDRKHRDAPHVDDVVLGVILAAFWPVILFIAFLGWFISALTNFGYRK